MYKRNCPKCKKELFHTSEKNCNRAHKKSALCRTCSKRKHDDKFYENLSRNCPECNDIISYLRFSDKKIALDNNSLCKKCSINSGKLKKGHKLNDIYNISDNSLEKLLQETPESFYWLGFIIADGSFSNNKFELTLAQKDFNHLKKFAKFIEFENKLEHRIKTNSFRLAFSDRISVSKVKEKYDLKNRKTYNPVNFEVLCKYKRELLMCLLVGIIDGDGCISINGSKRSRVISIASHRKWKKFYYNIIKSVGLEKEFKIRNINNTNTISINLYQREKILFLINDVIKKHNLPFLERKWAKIPLD